MCEVVPFPFFEQSFGVGSQSLFGFFWLAIHVPGMKKIEPINIRCNLLNRIMGNHFNAMFRIGVRLHDNLC